MVKKKTTIKRRRPQKHTRKIKVGPGLREVRIILINEEVKPPVKKKAPKRKPSKKKPIKKTTRRKQPKQDVVTFHEKIPESKEPQESDEDMTFVIFDERVPFYIEEKVPFPYDPSAVPAYDEIMKDIRLLKKEKGQIPTIDRRQPQLIKAKKFKKVYDPKNMQKNMEEAKEEADKERRKGKRRLDKRIKEFDEKFSKARPDKVAGGEEKPRPKGYDYWNSDFILIPSPEHFEKREKAADRKRKAEEKAQIKKDKSIKKQKREVDKAIEVSEKRKAQLKKEFEKIVEEQKRIIQQHKLSGDKLKANKKTVTFDKVTTTPQKPILISGKDLKTMFTQKELNAIKSKSVGDTLHINLNLVEKKKPKRIQFTVQRIMPEEFRAPKTKRIARQKSAQAQTQELEVIDLNKALSKAGMK